jgi:glycyl-tRNA synthetase
VLLLGLKGLDFDLRRGLQAAVEELPLPSSPENQADCLDFIVGRMRSYLLDPEQGFRYDVVEAVVSGQSSNPARVFCAAAELSRWVARPDWNTVQPAYSRCVRITRDQKQRFEIAPEAFVDPAEGALWEALQTAEQAARQPGSVDDFFTVFLPLIPVINRFFEAVMVMAEEPAVRANRLGLLQRVAALAKGTADFSKLEGF